MPHILLALYTEIGEFANEVESFKYWKINKRFNRKNMLEEWADCVHFTFSILNELGQEYGEGITFEGIRRISDEEVNESKIEAGKIGTEQGLTVMFLSLYDNLADSQAQNVLILLVNIMYILEFNEEELVKAYVSKNRKNFKRQRQGY